ncbi:MAG: glycosyltransferase [Bernardetiaceae bacterium]|nr:glycosyltransferase [Bernardetiaceae bacterium]
MKLTVITVCFNAAKALKKTIKSVASQDFESFEYLIIDGKSTDDTLVVISDNQSVINHWVSEPDAGIYDAMNKGMRLAKGDYILYLNAGDTFYSEQSLSQLFAQATDTAVLIYGDYQVINESYNEIVRAEPLDTPWTGMKFCHQSMALRREWALRFPFSGDYITSDFEQVYEIYQAGAEFCYVPIVVANFMHDGISTKNKLRVRFESLHIVRKHDKSAKSEIAFLKKILNTYAVEAVRTLLPKKTFEQISQYKIRLTNTRKSLS